MTTKPIRRSKLLIKAPRAELALTIRDGVVSLRATQIKPGFFNEHVTMEIAHADAVRLYLWLGETVGKVQP